MTPKPVVIVPKHGRILDTSAPFWQGDTAEGIIAKRRAQYQRDAEAKAEARAAKRAAKGHAPSARSPKTPSQKLRRLERALARRKTLAGRQRIKQQIRELQQELDT